MRIGIHIGRAHIAAAAIADNGAACDFTVPVAHPFDFAEAVDDSESGRAMLAFVAERKEAAQAAGEAVTAIAFELSGALSLEETAPVSVRIAPRAPTDPAHELRELSDEFAQVRILHVRGGHSTTGDELAPLDLTTLEQAVADLPRGLRYVVTGVGSSMNPAHERAIGKLLMRRAGPASIGYSRDFYSTSFATRERTALINARLMSRAGRLSTMLGTAVRSVLPDARPYVISNDGCCAPLARLAVTPVHALLAARPARLVGASALLERPDQALLVAADEDPFIGEIAGGVPLVGARFYRFGDAPVATQGANLISPRAAALHEDRPLPVVATPGYEPDWFDPSRAEQIAADTDLAALGAAVAPVVEWRTTFATVSTEADFRRALGTAESYARARLVADGIAPANVRILESRGEATTFEHPNVVGLRVRAAVDGLWPRSVRGGIGGVAHAALA